MKWIVWFLFFLGIPACSLHAPSNAAAAKRELAERVQNTRELKILFIGNSYSFGVPKAFSRLVKLQGKSVFVDQSTHNGWTLSRHAGSRQTLEKIRERPWDIVVLQEQSTLPAKSRIERELLMHRPLRKLVAEICNQGALPILYQTWGRRDNFLPMNARLRNGYREAAKDSGEIPVVPVGDAWEKAILAGNGSDLFSKDGSHPTAKGNALTAKTFLEFIYP